MAVTLQVEAGQANTVYYTVDGTTPTATLGFVPVPAMYWPLLLATLLCYVGLTQLIKTWLLRKGWV
jgi:hypothetical protein